MFLIIAPLGSPQPKLARNLKHRIEVVAPVRDPELQRFLKESILATYLRDNVKARELRADGTYSRVAQNGKRVNSQTHFMAEGKPAEVSQKRDAAPRFGGED
ncbi:MAG: hypothetical protein ABJB97_11070 [Acidobacteriota bacterium]